MTTSETEISSFTNSRPRGVRTLTVMPRLLALVSANWPVELGPGSTPSGTVKRFWRSMSMF